MKVSMAMVMGLLMPSLPSGNIHVENLTFLCESFIFVANLGPSNLSERLHIFVLLKTITERSHVRLENGTLKYVQKLKYFVAPD